MAAFVLIAEFMDQVAVDRLAERFTVHYDPGLVDRRAELLTLLPQADALIVRNRTRVDAEVLRAGARLRVVGRLGVGLDNIDQVACGSRKIQVIPATGANALAVAEYVVAAALVLLRRSFFASDAVSRGQWPRSQLSAGREVAGKSIGLVGYGGIGRLTAGLARALGMSICAYDPGLPADSAHWDGAVVRCDTLPDLLARADVISLHIPLVDGTRNLFDAALISRMRAGSVLINTSRGGIVDERAVVDALRAGHLGGAALDVYATEPLGDTVWMQGVPNLILTPHIAGVSFEANERVSALIADRVTQALAT